MEETHPAEYVRSGSREEDMKRQVSLEEISDGRLYDKNDMVRAGCGGCRGCSSCCQGMGNSVVLDPMDIYRLTVGLDLTFEELMADKIELNVVDGIILPNLKMSAGSETCGFLDAQGRCSIHAQRPGICRLFPLGRYYEKTDVSRSTSSSGTPAIRRTFRYFLQVHECPAPNKTKVRVSKWVDTPDLVRYEEFIRQWHYFLEDTQERIEGGAEDIMKNASMLILKLFYIMPYEVGTDFYAQFDKRLSRAKEMLAIER